MGKPQEEAGFPSDRDWKLFFGTENFEREISGLDSATELTFFRMSLFFF